MNLHAIRVIPGLCTNFGGLLKTPLWVILSCHPEPVEGIAKNLVLHRKERPFDNLRVT